MPDVTHAAVHGNGDGTGADAATGAGGGTHHAAGRSALPVRPSPMSRPGLFLARDIYRQRRLRDAARMLPVLGAIVWLMPLMWRREPDEAGGTAAAVVFLFAGWALLIVLAALIARRLTPVAVDADAPR
ncbi:hypothetical protein SAMN04488003_101397 [Loktanella fryxellensis]|uniref:Uncharacterized protein n=1 Tax=Loktanella fryxellensis TaxID=245187 RepID=A0A1H7YZZ5_9RHOB|nr:hypothetical protein [Loktanella fryxellensis]SEM51882.1 hypothetical protein SAMN04488003_101397 [Loktanella fryxellensis]